MGSGPVSQEPTSVLTPQPGHQPHQALSPMFMNQTPQVDPLLGAQVGSYRILKLLGTGGMGSVYLGEHTGIGSRAAIKFLHEHLSSNTDLVQRFYAEARSVNLIGHANIVSIFDMNVLPPNRYYLVMEYLEGRSLEALVQQGPMPMARAIPILSQVCDALDEAHAAGVVHRDLKPENLMLVKRGRQEDFVKILDFGIAKLQSTESSRKTATGVIIGTPDYMAPEQAGADTIDGRTDQYSLGVIAYELATGKTPFSGLPITAMLVAHLSQEPKKPHEVNPAVPQAISAVIMKALAKKPEARFASCGDFGQALELAFKESSTSNSAVAIAPPSEPAAQRATPAPADAVLSRVTPAAPAVPTPAVPRHVARFDVQVRLETGAEVTLACQDVSRAGCFVCSTQAPPRVFSRVTVTLPVVGPLIGDVVRHVNAEQSAAWNMPQGFGVQFINVKVEQRESLDALTRGLPVAPNTPAPVQSVADDPLTDRLLIDVRKRIQGDHYVVLGLQSDVDVPQVKTRGRELASQLGELSKRPISPGQRKQIDAALERLRHAVDVLSTPLKRAEFDGARFNWKGVAVSLSAGLRATELEGLHKAFLKANEGTEGRVALMMMSINAHERDGQFTDGLRLVEQALNMDPLNLALHHRRKSLLKSGSSPSRH
jgi:tRNA A-37 threonylcarbamoyl transferase component Bud32